MKKVIVTLAVLTMGLSSHLSFADGPGWTAPSKVEKLVVVSNGGVNVRLNPELNGCTSQGGYGQHYASIAPYHPGLQLMQSNLLAAYMAGKKVRLYLSDDTCKALEMIIED